MVARLKRRKRKRKSDSCVGLESLKEGRHCRAALALRAAGGWLSPLRCDSCRPASPGGECHSVPGNKMLNGSPGPFLQCPAAGNGPGDPFYLGRKMGDLRRKWLVESSGTGMSRLLGSRRGDIFVARQAREVIGFQCPATKSRTSLQARFCIGPAAGNGPGDPFYLERKMGDRRRKWQVESSGTGMSRLPGFKG